MPNKKYISINVDADGLQERSLRADVGEFAYSNQGVIVAPFDVVEIGIGSWRYDAESWDNVENAPNLPSKGHFLVWVTAENTKEIRFVADETRDESCIESRVGELIVIEGVAESWNYYVSNNETYKFGEIALPSAYDKGKANDTKLRTLSADHVRQYAYMNRGKRVDVVNFNTTLTHGNTHVEFLAGSIGAPPTTENKGVLRNEIAGCLVHQYWLPANSDALFFRERSEAKVWGSWYSATAGNVLSNGKVRVPTYYKRGIGNGYQDVEVYSANQVDTKFKVLSGTGTNVVQTEEGFVVNWTGTTQSLGADLPLLYDPVTGKVSISPTKVSQWDAAYNYGPHAGLYAPIGRNLTVGGTAGRIAVTGGLQSLAADRSWAVDLVAIHAGLTAGSTTQVAVPTVDAYGRVTALTNASIAFPVTSVNGKTGAVALSTTDVPEGVNLYWTNARGDARYSPLGHTHTWAQITDKPDLAGLYVPVVRTLSFLGAAGQIDITGGSQSLVSNRTWTVGLATVHAGLSGGSGITTPAINVDTYGRVTSLTYSTILFPVTSVNGKTGAVSLSTTDVPEGTNLYWTNARGDARYSPLGHTHTWAEISDKPDLAGLYVPVVRTLSFLGAAGQIAITGGSQSLISNRTWTVGLETVHAGLSGGSGITTPAINVDTYGRVTSLTYSTILFPVTSVNGKTGAVSLSTTDVPEGTNLYWTNARGDARYSPLSHTHTWAQISDVPAFLLQAYTTVQADTLPVNQRSNLNFSQEFAISDSAANNRTTVSIAAVPYAKVTGVPAFITTETDPTVPSHVKSIGTSDIAAWNAKANASGTLNYVAKFTGSTTLGNSSIFDSGNVGIGTNDPGPHKLRVNGAIYSDGDEFGVSLWMPAGRAIRASGTFNIDAGASSPIYFRSGGGATYLMELNANGKLRFNTYYSATAWTGTPVALLGTDNGGNVLTLSTLLYADRIHGHGIGDISGLQPALDNRPTWGDVYTKTQLNTSGAGGVVHWDNISNKPDFAYAGHGHTIPEISGLQSALDGKTPWGHGHIIADVSGLQSALDNRPTWGDVYTRTQLNTSGAGGLVHWDNVSNKPGSYNPSYHRTNYSDIDGMPSFITGETDPKGYDSHWFSLAGRNLTLGVQRRDTTQGYASVTLPWNYQYDIATQQLLNGNHLIRLNRDDGYYVDRTITETDPKGVSSCYGSYSSGTLSITIVLRDGTPISCNIPFSGPS